MPSIVTLTINPAIDISRKLSNLFQIGNCDARLHDVTQAAAESTSRALYDGSGARSVRSIRIHTTQTPITSIPIDTVSS
jgi:hypothetical protein